MPAFLDPQAKITAAAAADQPEKAPFVPEMRALCTKWSKSRDFASFSQLIQFTLDKELMSLSDFRDYFAVMPAFVLMWAIGSMEPPLSAQTEIVEFIDRRAPSLPKPPKRPNEEIARALFERRMAGKTNDLAISYPTL